MKYTDTIPFKENTNHGTQDFPCAFYMDSNMFAPAKAFFQVKHHWHEELEIIYFIEGNFQLEVNMQTYNIAEECFFFIQSEELHYIYAENRFEEKALVFSLCSLCFRESDPVQSHIIQPLTEQTIRFPRMISHNHPCFPELKDEFCRISSSFDGAANPTAYQAQYAVKSPIKYTRIKAALYNILALLAEHQLFDAATTVPATDRRIATIKHALSYMEANASEKLYIRNIADHVNMNEQYFCRFFKKIIGKSPIGYLNELRIKNACRLLTNTDSSVMEICLECGFNNLGNFMHAFRKYCDCTPLQYRKQNSRF